MNKQEQIANLKNEIAQKQNELRELELIDPKAENKTEAEEIKEVVNSMLENI